jgi:hypothetical protein
MSARSKYERVRAGKWRLTILPAHWNQELQERVLALAEAEAAAKHPKTLELTMPVTAEGKLYLKIFHPPPGAVHLKTFFGKSKASRFLRQGIALSEAGFDVPVTIAAGERRSWGLLQRSLVLTLPVSGRPLASFMLECFAGGARRITFREKVMGLKSLASLIRKFHQLGFVHGDLVPSNIFVSVGQDGKPVFCFMDNDRTRRYPRWLPQNRWKRNLVQLNRFPLPGIWLHDRVRFLRFYCGRVSRRSADDRLLHWLEIKTRRRRKECDGVGGTMDFRELMRWQQANRKMK